MGFISHNNLFTTQIVNSITVVQFWKGEYRKGLVQCWVKCCWVPTEPLCVLLQTLRQYSHSLSCCTKIELPLQTARLYLNQTLTTVNKWNQKFICLSGNILPTPHFSLPSFTSSDGLTSVMSLEEVQKLVLGPLTWIIRWLIVWCLVRLVC